MEGNEGESVGRRSTPVTMIHLLKAVGDASPGEFELTLVLNVVNGSTVRLRAALVDSVSGQVVARQSADGACLGTGSGEDEFDLLVQEICNSLRTRLMRRRAMIDTALEAEG